MFRSILNYLHCEFQSGQAYLLPLRLFIGLGWIRAGVEKLIDPAWGTGETLTRFLTDHVATGAVHFPFYESLIHQVFLPNVVVLSWIIVIGQLMAGLGIFSGTLTNAALIGGMFMNLNFILAGAVSPSAFYLIIQTILFVGSIGAICGVDRSLSNRIPSIFITARPTGRLRPYETTIFLGIAFFSWAVMLLFIPSIRDFGPLSVDDPAMLISILAGLGGLTSIIIFLQNKAIEPEIEPAMSYGNARFKTGGKSSAKQNRALRRVP